VNSPAPQVHPLRKDGADPGRRARRSECRQSYQNRSRLHLDRVAFVAWVPALRRTAAYGECRSLW